MTEGISKDELLGINPLEYCTHRDLLEAIISRCRELDPWLPIDENTPKDEYFNLFVPGHRIITGKIDTWVLDVDGRYLHPTHYKLLPEDPK